MSSNSLIGRIVDAVTGSSDDDDGDCCCGVRIEETESED